MGIFGWTVVFAILSFGLYLGIAVRSRVRDTKGFYVADANVPAVANGAAIAADWMSAASFISMAGIVAFSGYGGSLFLMGWTGGYVLLALLLAPYLRKFGKYTVPDFVGDRYSETARAVAVVAAVFVSFTYVAGQMRGVGIVFSRFLELSITAGVLVGVGVVLIYAVLGGMKGITWTQVAQYAVLIVAYLVPAIAIANHLTGNPVPHISFGEIVERLNGVQADLGFGEYSTPFTDRGRLDMFLATATLMCGTAGLPHVIVRFYTAKSVRAARWSAFWALAFIAILYTTAPAVAAFAKSNMLDDVSQQSIDDVPAWVGNWEETGLIEINDLDEDGIIDYTPYNEENPPPADDPDATLNELTVDRDIMVLANPEVAGLPAPVVGLVAAGGLAAALSTASGLLLVISSSIAHDLYYKRFRPEATEKQRLLVGRIAMAAAVGVAGYFGVNPPGFVAEVVALAFGLAAASFFPVIVLGIFWKRANAQGAIAGLTIGLTTAALYMYFTLFQDMEPWFDISAISIGAISMLLNAATMVVVSRLTPPPPPEMQEFIEHIRHPGDPAAGAEAPIEEAAEEAATT